MILTLIIVSLVVRYLRPYLKKVLIDLCGTEEREQFWTAFSNILLIGLPLIFSLNYRPESTNSEYLFFNLAGQLSDNLGGLLLALICVGIVVSFFALSAPKQPKVEAK
jgi:hypothetical protein